MVAHERRVDRAQRGDRALVVGADHDAVGLHEVLDRRALLQEFRVRRRRRIGASSPRAAELLGDRRAHAVGGADRHRRLVDDDLELGHPAADGARRGEHVLHVGRAVLLGRRADGDELQRAVRDGRVESVVKRSRPAATLRRIIGSSPGSWIGTPPCVRAIAILRGVDVEAQHVVADFGEARAGDEPDVARADHGDLHAVAPSDALIAASAASGSGACVIGRPMTR